VRRTHGELLSGKLVEDACCGGGSLLWWRTLWETRKLALVKDVVGDEEACSMDDIMEDEEACSMDDIMEDEERLSDLTTLSLSRR